METITADRIKEVLQRVTRIETRLMSLGTRLGVDLKDDDKITVDVGGRVVRIAAMDVAFTSVVNAARRAGLRNVKVDVFHNEELVANIKV